MDVNLASRPTSSPVLGESTTAPHSPVPTPAGDKPSRYISHPHPSWSRGNDEFWNLQRVRDRGSLLLLGLGIRSRSPEH